MENAQQDTDYIDWNGFALPFDYGNAEQEYFAIRESCAIFDVTPLRKYRIKGPEAGAFLDYLLSRPVSTATNQRSIYVVYCNEDGSVKDDAILHKYADDDYLLLPSDIDHSVYFYSLLEQLNIQDISIVDCTYDLHSLAIQGPMSATVLQHMGIKGIESLNPFEIQSYPFDSGVMRVTRVGFTADLGYECWFEPELDGAVAEAVKSARNTLGISIPGYGLTALDACRLEGGFIVAGWDFSTEADPQPGFERTPFELGLGWMVNLNAGEFVGKRALMEQHESGPGFCLRSFELGDGRTPEDGTSVYTMVDGDKVEIGQINCSAWSWGLQATIGNVSVRSQYQDVEAASFDIDGESLDIRLSQGPLRKFAVSRQSPAPIYG